jgi:hypothetical protein
MASCYQTRLSGQESSHQRKKSPKNNTSLRILVMQSSHMSHVHHAMCSHGRYLLWAEPMRRIFSVDVLECPQVWGPLAPRHHHHRRHLRPSVSRRRRPRRTAPRRPSAESPGPSTRPGRDHRRHPSSPRARGRGRVALGAAREQISPHPRWPTTRGGAAECKVCLLTSASRATGTTRSAASRSGDRHPDRRVIHTARPGESPREDEPAASHGSHGVAVQYTGPPV